MNVSELLQNSLILNIELHVSFLIVIAFLFNNMRKSFIRNGRRREISLYIAYIGVFVMLIADVTWTVISTLTTPGNLIGYGVNLIYFLSSSASSFAWYIFCTKELGTKSSKKTSLLAIIAIPYVIVNILYLLSPMCGLIFSIYEGAYVRGSLFFMDPLVKMGYIVAASVLAIIYGSKKEIGYLKKKDFDFALFAVPVIVCGIPQALTGVDFTCMGVTCGFALIYVVGITNQDIENTDAIYSLADSFEASYIVNMDTEKIRPLHEDRMHESDVPGMDSMDYTYHFQSVLSKILLPEDRSSTLEQYDISNVAKRFEIDSSFSLRYRVKENSGETAMHTASFIKAEGRSGKNEFLLGINTLSFDSLLYERNGALCKENQKLEEINLSIIESVAKIVEARDGGSGAHIVRVKRLTEILARELMVSCPELKLDEERIKLISSASVLHDVGKIVIPDAILLKPGKLTEEEFEIMKTHSTSGCDILNMFPLGLDDAFLECALSICRWHHEKYDGKGYPDGLKGSDIPIEAQIVSAADCFDALVSDRPYKKAYSPEKSLEMILNGECGEYSSEIKNALQKQRNKLIGLMCYTA